MKKSLNAWTVDGNATFEEMFSQVKEAGFDTIELNVDKEGHSAHSLTLTTTQEELAAIKALSEKYDLPVVSISSSLWAGKMGSDYAYGKALLAKQLECCKALGGTGILIVPGGGYPSVSLMEDREKCIAFLQQEKDLIDSYGIYVGVENVWNGFFMSPLDMSTFIDAVGNPLVGAYYDVGNVVAFSFTERWIEHLGGRIHNIHVKDYLRNRGINSGGEWKDLTEGSIDWKAVIKALKSIGFDGPLTAEVFKADESQSYQDYYKKIADEFTVILADAE